MKTSWHTELPQWIVIAAMFTAAAVCWSQAPDHMPIHWNLKGEVDGYGGKFAGLLLLPLIALGLNLLTLALPYIDPGRRNYPSFATAYHAVRIVLVVFMGIIYACGLLVAFGVKVDVATVVCLSSAGLLCVIGNFMGKIRPNWFIGVRTPWTLSSRMSWNKTHRLAGWLFLVMGLSIAISGIYRAAWMFVATLVIIISCVVWMILYSYLVYRRDPDRISPAGISPEN